MILLTKNLKTKRKLLIAQLNSKRSSVNEQQLEKAISKYFKGLREDVLKNLEEYWSEYQLLQGQINLIIAPIEESHDKYYNILVKHDKREYQLGVKEAERLIDIINGKHAEKGIRRVFRRIIRNDEPFFGTLKWTEEDLLNKTFIASKRTLARVTSEINQLITQGYTSGKGINVVANMLTQRFNQLETWEAKRIARTEIHNSHNQGVMRTYETMNVSYTQWIAADDDRTRESHAEINGEIIPMGGTYSNGLQYPGDTNGPIEEWINCRCSNAPFVIPYGYIAPPGMEQFREEDLIPTK